MSNDINYMHMCVYVHAYMQPTHVLKTLKLSGSATARMLRRPPDNSPPTDHRITFSTISKYCELRILNQRLGVTRKRTKKDGERGNRQCKPSGGKNITETKNHT